MALAAARADASSHRPDAGALGEVGALGLSALLAAATYRYIERPLRFGLVPARAVKALTAAMVAVAGMGVALSTGAISGRFQDRAEFVAYFENAAPGYAYLNRLGIEQLYRIDCNFYDYATKRPIESIPPDCVAHAQPRRVLLWGDSHAQHLRLGLQTVLGDDVSLMQVTTAGCAPWLGDRIPDRLGACNRSNRFALELIESTKPQIVVIAQGSRHDQTDWVRLAEALRSRGVGQVVLVGPVPRWKPELHRVVATQYWPTPPRYLNTALDRRTVALDRALADKLRGSTALRYASAVDALCNETGCLSYLGDDVMTGLTTWDYGHLTPATSVYVAERLFGAQDPLVLR